MLRKSGLTHLRGDIRVRCITQPDAAQNVLLERLVPSSPSGCEQPNSTQAPSASAPLLNPKCSADFSDNLLTLLISHTEPAQIGLTFRRRGWLSHRYSDWCASSFLNCGEASQTWSRKPASPRC